MRKINKNGQALTEYILIIALIAVLAVFLVDKLGGYLKDAITKTGCELTSSTYVAGEKPGDAICKDESKVLE